MWPNLIGAAADGRNLRKEFGRLLQRLEFLLAKVLLQDHDFVALKMYGSEAGSASWSRPQSHSG